MKALIKSHSQLARKGGKAMAELSMTPEAKRNGIYVVHMHEFLICRLLRHQKKILGEKPQKKKQKTKKKRKQKNSAINLDDMQVSHGATYRVSDIVIFSCSGVRLDVLGA
jgi:ABC-type uncharacterized transport system ATPase subunit